MSGRGRAAAWVDPGAHEADLRNAGHHAPERFLAMLSGDVGPDDVREIRRRIAIWGCRVSVDTITIALLAHQGVDHAVLAHAATLRGAMFLRDREGRQVLSMNPDGQADVTLDAGRGVRWVSGFEAAGDMYTHPDLEPRHGVFAVEPLPDSVLASLPGRPLMTVVSHPALDGMDLRIAQAAQGEFHTLIQPSGHTFRRMAGLIDHLPPKHATRG